MAIPRIPYTAPFPAPPIIPPSATTLAAAVAATARFFAHHPRVVLLTGAGISVASGLADYRGVNGTYRRNRAYRPIFFAEFAAAHASRQRYWARSFLGWPAMERARPNAAHVAAARLHALGAVPRIVTQNVDSLHIHPLALTPGAVGPPPTTELHGTLRTLTCLTCGTAQPRRAFQTTLEALNPAWREFLATATQAGAFDDNDNGNGNGLKANPDGDVDLPGAPYSAFRYPPCARCLADSSTGRVYVDTDGAHLPDPGERSPSVGVLKPSVTFFGESVNAHAKEEAEQAVVDADAVLVLGSSLATYSAFRLVRAAKEAGKGVGVVNLGGIRGEDTLFEGTRNGQALRVEFGAGEVLAGALAELGGNVDVDVDVGVGVVVPPVDSLETGWTPGPH